MLVVTHEHWDHVSGFVQARDAARPDKLTVGEVWLAWTEKPDDPTGDCAAQRNAPRQSNASSVRRIAWPA